MGSIFRQLELSLTGKVSPTGLSFITKSWGKQRNSLNSGILIIHCNLWRLDDKMPNSDGSTNKKKWFFSHFQSFSSKGNGDVTRCQIPKTWRSEWFHWASLYLGYYF
jgi:hypothetical protein